MEKKTYAERIDDAESKIADACETHGISAGKIAYNKYSRYLKLDSFEDVLKKYGLSVE